MTKMKHVKQKIHRQNETNSSAPLEQQREQEQQLVKDLIDTEGKIAALQKEEKNYEKQINYMKRSNTWKYSKPFRKLQELFTKWTGRKKKVDERRYVHQLETQLSAVQKQLYETREQLRETLLDDRHLDHNQIIPLTKQLRDEGKLIDFLQRAIDDKRQHETNYNNLLIYAARTFMNDQPQYRNFVYSNVLKALNIEHIPEFMIRAGLDEYRIPLTEVASFRASLHMRMRQKQLLHTLPEFLLDDKSDAYRFIDELGIRRPKVSEDIYRLEQIPKREGIVIKPADGAGSRGVYLVNRFSDIIDVKRRKRIDRWEALHRQLIDDLKADWVHDDQWLIEEIIYEDEEKTIPASDLKFYCFYGKVGIILEITRYPDLKYCWWTATGERIRAGKYDEDIFQGKGVSEREVELARKMSLKIPAPFIRIDFLRSSDGLVFGEFTPKPGNYDEFDDVTDQKLGDYYIEAEGRLTKDLLNGKPFNEYKQFVESKGNEKEKFSGGYSE